jgi:hypothetical protein
MQTYTCAGSIRLPCASFFALRAMLIASDQLAVPERVDLIELGALAIAVQPVELVEGDAVDGRRARRRSHGGSARLAER